MRLHRLFTVLCQWGALAAFAMAIGFAPHANAAPDRLAAAKEAVKKAAADEKKTHDEWNAREMARSATREIGVAARATTERALQQVVAAEESLKEKKAAAQSLRNSLAAAKDQAKSKSINEDLIRAEAAVAAAEKRLAERFTTLRSAAERMINEQRVLNQAAGDLRVIELTMAQKMQATRKAERAVLVLEAEAAKATCKQAVAEKAAAEAALKGKSGAAKTAADKTYAEKAAACNAAADKVAGSEKALHETDVVAAVEAQAWLGVERNTLLEMESGNAAAAQIAGKLAAADPDPKFKKTFEEFAAKMTARKNSEVKAAAEKLAAIRAADRPIDMLRAAARGGLKPLAPEAWDYAKARHLLVRAGFGGTPQEVARLHAMGLYRAVDYLVDFQRLPAPNLPFDAVPFARPDPMEGKLRNDFVRGQVAGSRAASEGAQMQHLRLWWVQRLVESPRPLQEKLTLFWHGHFANQYSVVRHSYAFYHQNQMFRENAAGNFGGLLYGIVHDPVMIRYLDNNTNVKGHANENLAREIMELFAMGVDQGYMEKDIREAARALTGYTYDHQTGQFRYIEGLHDESPKTIFGQTGNFTGDDVVRLILEQPATARFIAGKLFRYFAHDNPSDATVNALANVLRSQQYELAPMLKSMFISEEFYSDRTVGTQIKNPVQLVVGMFRDFGVKDIADFNPLDLAMRSMGQELFEPPDVKGWREGRSWVNTNRMFIRYNAITELMNSVPRRQNKAGLVLTRFLEGKGCSTAEQVVDYFAKACLMRPLTPEKRAELIEFLGALPPPTQWAAQRDVLNERFRSVLILMTSMPEYQLT